MCKYFWAPRVGRQHVQCFYGTCHCVLMGSLRHAILMNPHSRKSNMKSLNPGNQIWSFPVSSVDKYPSPSIWTHAQLEPSTDKSGSIVSPSESTKEPFSNVAQLWGHHWRQVQDGYYTQHVLYFAHFIWKLECQPWGWGKGPHCAWGLFCANW